MKPIVKEDGTLEYSVWVKSGSMMYNRECLESDHPENLYNHLRSHGIEPEDYGISPPLSEEESRVMYMSKEKMAKELIAAYKTIKAMEAAGF